MTLLSALRRASDLGRDVYIGGIIAVSGLCAYLLLSDSSRPLYPCPWPSPMPRSPFELTIPSRRRRECLQLLATWDAHDPWNDVAAQRLTGQLLALIADVTKQRILDVRGGEAAAKKLRGAVGAARD